MSNTIPFWADELLNQVCKDEGRSRKPKVSWGYSTQNVLSSGHYSPRQRRIRITAGTSGSDHKQVFLHEITHWLQHRNPKRIYFYGEKRKKNRWHNKRFYTKLKELLVRYDCLTEEYRVREHGYMKRSSDYL